MHDEDGCIMLIVMCTKSGNEEDSKTTSINISYINNNINSINNK